jgi:hypothetical protein
MFCDIRNGLPELAFDENVEHRPLPVLDIRVGHASYADWPSVHVERRPGIANNRRFSGFAGRRGFILCHDVAVPRYRLIGVSAFDDEGANANPAHVSNRRGRSDVFEWGMAAYCAADAYRQESRTWGNAAGKAGKVLCRCPSASCMVDGMEEFLTPTAIKGIVEIVAVSMLPIGFIGFMLHRVVTQRALSTRSIQFLGVVFLLPVILVLALEKVLDSTAVGTLIGALIGYLLSAIANYEPQRRDDNAPRS